MTEVHGDAQATIALILDRLDLTETRRDSEALVDACLGFGLRGATALGLVQHESDYIL